MTEKLRLYYAPDNASLCVRLALLEMGLQFDTALVDRRQRSQKDPPYLALNPNGLIPTLVTPNGPIFETGAILLKLADNHVSPLFPAPGDTDRGTALAWLFWLSNTLHATLRMTFYPEQYTSDPASILPTCRARLSEYLTILETHLDVARTAPLLQCYIMPMLRWMALYGDDTSWFDPRRWPQLLDLAQRYETTDTATAAAQAEGLGPTPFSAPIAANPPEGSAT